MKWVCPRRSDSPPVISMWLYRLSRASTGDSAISTSSHAGHTRTTRNPTRVYPIWCSSGHKPFICCGCPSRGLVASSSCEEQYRTDWCQGRINVLCWRTQIHQPLYLKDWQIPFEVLSKSVLRMLLHLCPAVYDLSYLLVMKSLQWIDLKTASSIA